MIVVSPTTRDLASKTVCVQVDSSYRKAAQCGGCTTERREWEVIQERPALLATRMTCQPRPRAHYGDHGEGGGRMRVRDAAGTRLPTLGKMQVKLMSLTGLGM